MECTKYLYCNRKLVSLQPVGHVSHAIYVFYPKFLTIHVIYIKGCSTKHYVFQLQMLQALLDEYKPMLEALNDTGSRLSSLVQGPAAAEISDIVAKDNEKYEAISALVNKRVEKINLQRAKSVEVRNLVCWT